MKTFRLQKRKFEVFTGFLCLYSLMVAPFVRATELVITDNGSGSSSEVTVTSEAQTGVTQSNTADVSNSVSAEATTGGNTASDNSGGDTTIQTGDVNAQTSIDNQVNTSVADTGGCCDSGTTAAITENGDDSDNNINLQEQSTNTVTVTQNATVTNSVKGYANTGKNEANDNSGGSTAISTGDIKINTQINNDPVNVASVKSTVELGGVSVKIAGNGSETANTISATIVNDPSVFINNFSDVDNFVHWEANTGGNQANGNTGGDVTITTGNIDLGIFIHNLVNIAGVDIHCCDIYDPGDQSSDEDGGNGGNGDGSSSDSSSSNGFSGSSVPSGSEAGMGGVGVLGLSDTSSGEFQSAMFMLGIILCGLGVKFVGETLEGTSLAKRKHLG
jgi:hypothetical protein